MITSIRLFFFLMVTSIIPMTTFSLSSADFNKKMAEIRPSSPQCNSPNVSISTPAPTPHTQADRPPPIYYAPAAPFNASPAATPTPTPTPAPETPSTSSKDSLWGSSNSDPFIIAH